MRTDGELLVPVLPPPPPPTRGGTGALDVVVEDERLYQRLQKD